MNSVVVEIDRYRKNKNIGRKKRIEKQKRDKEFSLLIDRIIINLNEVYKYIDANKIR